MCGVRGGTRRKGRKNSVQFPPLLRKNVLPPSPLSSPFFHLIPLFSVSPSHPMASPPQVYCMPGDFSHEQGPLSSFFSVPVMIIFSLLLRRFSRPPFFPRTWGHSHAVLGCWNSCGGGGAHSQKGILLPLQNSSHNKSPTPPKNLFPPPVLGQKGAFFHCKAAEREEF